MPTYCSAVGAIKTEITTSVARPPIPIEERKPAWRAACLAYREKRSEGSSDQEAHEAAVAAVQSVLPLPWKEASAEAVSAVAYASRHHSEWFWRGVSGER
jgi:hypothetical protein